MFKKILIPLDGSEHSLKIVGWATGLAQALKARIVLLSVIDPEDIEILEAMARGHGPQAKSTRAGAVRAATRTPAEVIDDALAQAKTGLMSESEKVKSAGVSVSVHVAAGSPAEEIVAEANALGVDLIAMATRRESALARGVLGSVTDRVLHSTPIPILTMHPGERKGFGDDNGPPTHVIVPLDGSELSESAVQPALEIASAAGADLIFTETVRLPFYGVGVAGIEYGSGDYAGDFGIDAQKDEISVYLKGFVEKAEAAGLVARASVRTGSPTQQIVQEAAESEGSIIVMASRGAGGLRRWVLGSVADKVIRSAHRPVIVIPHTTR